MKKIVLFFVFILSVCGDVMASNIGDDDVVTIPINTGESEDSGRGFLEVAGSGLCKKNSRCFRKETG